ncbi:MAG: hypothetical protein IE880_03915, partial [Epsilonproteobacteria bacterium]|nr:hypothetical protein [Campylobacterota bacterium]
MKFKITASMLIGVSLLFFTGCGGLELWSGVSLSGKQGGQLENGLPKPIAHKRNTDSTTRSIENAFAKSKDLDKTYIYADRDGSNIILTGIVAN